jgi:hydroxymethylbilane synthase
MKVIIGSRGSPLALWQANWVKDRLATAGFEVEIRIIKTTGDKLAHVPLAHPGSKGLFIKEIEEALTAGEVDLAVHSMKDVPTEQPSGLVVAAVPEREDARDVLITRDGKQFAQLPPGARVGTSSVRRQAQLRKLRSDLELVPMRGNLDTRLRRLARGDCDALVLAAAGVHRLGLRGRITEYFTLDQVCSAVGQGALALEVRRGDERLERAVKPLDHAPTHLAVRAERALLQHLGGGCQVPIAAHARPEDERLNLVGVVASPDASVLVRATASGPMGDPEALGARVASDLLEQGAQTILKSI